MRHAELLVRTSTEFQRRWFRNSGVPCEVIVLEDVRYSPEKSKTQGLAAAFAAWK